MKINLTKYKSEKSYIIATYSENDLMKDNSVIPLTIKEKVNLDYLADCFYKGIDCKVIVKNPASDTISDISLPLIEVCMSNGKCTGCVFELNKFDWIESNPISTISIGSDHYRVVINTSSSTLFYSHIE